MVMVDRVKHATGLRCGRAEQQGGFAAVGTDLDTDTAVEVPQCGVVQRAPLVRRHETPHPFSQREQSLGRTGVYVIHPLNLSFGLAPLSDCPAAGPRSLYDHAVHALPVRKFVDAGLAAAMIAAALPLATAVLPPGTPGAAGPAAAANCPQVQIVFARGRKESGGPGVLGSAFINAVESKAGNRTIGTYAVKYPADTEVDVGANDMSHHIQDTVNNCPNTRLVLGGYSLGAAVTDVVLAAPDRKSVV